MSEIKSRDWAGIIGTFSVVAGLVLVAYQISQASLLIRAELGSQSYDRFFAIGQTYSDAAFANVWAKSLEDPKNLTLAEIIQLDGFLTSIGDTLDAEVWLFELGIFEGSFDADARQWAEFIDSSPFATAWWNEAKSGYLEGLVHLIDEHLNGQSDRFGAERYRRIRAEIGRQTSDQ